MNRILLELEDVGKRFEIYQVQKTLFRLGRNLVRGIPLKRELWALRHVSLRVEEGEKIALVGRNGAGKTTLLRLASGIYAPTEGRILRHASLSPLLRFGVGLNPQLSVLDNLYIVGAFCGLTRREVAAKRDAIFEFSGLGEFQFVPVKKLSSGQQLRLFFSVFIHTEEDFLAFDESTSFGDLEFQMKVLSYLDRLMRDPRKTVLLASHAFDTLKQYCGRALWLEAGELREIGPVDEVERHYLALLRPGQKLPQAQPVL